MILTCPECATSYFVDDDRIPAAGRTVKCSNCAARWTVTRETAEPEQELAPAVESAPDPEPEEEASRPPAPEPQADDDPPFRARVPRRPPAAAPPKTPVTKAMVLGGAAVAVAALLAAVIGLRGAIVERWPAASGAYAALGLSVNDLGLVIEDVQAKPSFQGGRPVLTVTGAIRNLRKDQAQAPPLEVSLLDKAGKPLAVKIAHPIERDIPALARRHFSLSLIDPPANLHDLEVRFQEVEDAPAKPPTPAAEDHHG